MRETFIIPGEPVAKGRPRMTRSGHVYTPSKTRLYEEHVRVAFKQKRDAEQFYSYPLRVFIAAYFSIPKSVSKKKRLAMDGTPHTKKCDADNVAKAVLDALNGVAFADDSAIHDLHIVKRYTMDEPRVEVTFEWDECPR